MARILLYRYWELISPAYSSFYYLDSFIKGDGNASFSCI